MGKSVGKVLKGGGLGAGLGAIFAAPTGGLSLLAGAGLGAATGAAAGASGMLGGNASAPGGVPGGQDPVTLLSQTGGAPLLANIAMGADIDTVLAGYLGGSQAQLKHALDTNEPYFGATYLGPQGVEALKNVRNQLQQIQGNRQVSQKAVDSLIQDFPNIMAQESQRAGAEFDTQMKSYVDNALQGTAAKFAANGGISSGAANEAFAKVGAESAKDRLQYTTNAGKDVFNTRLSEVNALRDFQNTMLMGQVQQGFSANQANLQRQFQGNAANAEMQNQRFMQDQQSQSSLFGALGSLGGSLLGSQMLGGSLFGSPSAGKTGDVFGKFNQAAPKTYTTSYGRILGGK